MVSDGSRAGGVCRTPGRKCFEPQVILWDGASIVDLETNAGLIIQAKAAYYISTREGNHPNVRGIDTVASHKW